MAFNQLINRVKNILLSPKTEWEIIKDEATSVQTLFLQYAMILAAIPALASIAYGLIFNGNLLLLIPALLAYAFSLVGIFIMAFVIDIMAPYFDAEKDFLASLKVVVYSSTAMWVAGAFKILPLISIFISLAGTIYTFYLMYIGLGQVKSVAADKLPLYFIVVLMLSIVLNFLIMGVVGIIGLYVMAGPA